ncbi:MAG TPA: GspE/PulE family protein [Thermodesulfovibrionia bacterium]|nr:GspE/PulE family protein [Thermodesulfovibrionia bacterium]
MGKQFDQNVLKILVDEGLLSQDNVQFIKSKETVQRSKLRKAGSSDISVSLVDVIVSLEIKQAGQDSVLTEDMIMESVASHINKQYVKIDPLKLDPDVVTGVISRPFAMKHLVLPVERSGRKLTIATADPFDQETIDWLERTTSYEVSTVVSAKTDILRIIREFYGFRVSVDAAHKDIELRHDISNLEQLVQIRSSSEIDSSDKHVVRAVEYLLTYAYSQRASDIHIEPKRDHAMVRFRIDGILHDINKIPKNVHPAIISRIKTLARLDIAEKRRPQDGRIKTEQDGKEVELRISTLATAFGEKVVIRIFDPGILLQNIEELGFPTRETKLFQRFISAPNGIILVTGPTGSGKTTTLYSALKTIATTEVNVTSIEDPIEMVYDGFNQTAVHPHIGITFASVLRTLLRQDPDIIMVGEIRDPETADNAIQASLTGHLVLSTLHTNDAPTSITRLLDLGVPPFLINPTILGIIAQRLVRKICLHCAEPFFLNQRECKVLGIAYEKVKHIEVAKGKGCAQCRNTGYYGRTGVFEILEMTEDIRELVEKKASPTQIRVAAKKQGMVLLKEAAIRKLLKQATTFEEVVRVTGSMA